VNTDDTQRLWIAGAQPIPAAPIVTARNKIRMGRKVLTGIVLDGRLAENNVILANNDSVMHNSQMQWSAARELVHQSL
jgi:hypothetical protein